MRILVLQCLVLAINSAGAAAQMRLPTHDGRGEALNLPPTVEMAFRQQQTILYALIGLLVLSLAALVWCCIQVVRMQHTVEKVAEAVRRVDLLALAFRTVSAEWDRGLLQQRIGVFDPAITDTIDLGDEPLSMGGRG